MSLMVRLDLALIRLLGLLRGITRLRAAGLVEEIMLLWEDGAITLGVRWETLTHIHKFRDRSGQVRGRRLALRTTMLLVQGPWGQEVVLELAGWE